MMFFGGRPINQQIKNAVSFYFSHHGCCEKRDILRLLFEKDNLTEFKNISEKNVSFWSFKDKNKLKLIYGDYLLIETEAAAVIYLEDNSGRKQEFSNFFLEKNKKYYTLVQLTQYANKITLTFKWLIKKEDGVVAEKWEGREYYLKKILTVDQIFQQQAVRGILPELNLSGAELCADKDFLLTNKRSSYVNLPLEPQKYHSRYQALLAANQPGNPDDKTVLVKMLYEQVIVDGQVYALTADNCLKFSRYPWPVWEFLLDGVVLRKTICLDNEEDLVMVNYQISNGEKVTVKVSPLIEDRNHHFVTKAYAVENIWPQKINLLSQENLRGFSFALSSGNYLYGYTAEPQGAYVSGIQWKYNIYAYHDKERGVDPFSDALIPGEFTLALGRDQESASLFFSAAGIKQLTVDDFWQKETVRATAILKALPQELSSDNNEKIMALALDQFLTRRDGTVSLIAGYPWFREWGRDSMIVVRGLLAAGRFQEARQLIVQFARLSKHGTFPNAINSGNDLTDRDTVDAPFLFILAVKEYLEYTDDDALLYQQLSDGRFILLVIDEIFESTINGAENGVYMDKKTGLIWTPAHYTWMDTSFPAATPREGYPVEIQAFWYSALNYLADLYKGIDQKKKAEKAASLAARVKESFSELFYLEKEEYLADTLYCGRGILAVIAVPCKALRPNQLAAIAAGLTEKKTAEKIIQLITEELLLSGFIRSRNEMPPQVLKIPYRENNTVKEYDYKPFSYAGAYQGDEDTKRKPSYHNGTGWMWLLGFFVDAWLNIYGNKDAERVFEYLYPAVEQLSEATIGNLSEICDGDFPHLPRGCSSQAWSVSEVLRSYLKLKEIMIKKKRGK